MAVADALRQIAGWMDDGGPTYHEAELIGMAISGPVECSSAKQCTKAAKKAFLEAARIWEFMHPDKPAEQQPVYQRCEYCDGTGDVHSIDGEWRGACDCQKPAPDAIELDPKDLIVQLWSSRVRSQWDCSLERGVKITHVPSGTSVTCDTERSMYANKNKALCDLQSQLSVNPAPDVAGLVNALEGLLGVIGESRGVSGYHLNGEIAEWGEFQAVHDATAALDANRKGGEV